MSRQSKWPSNPHAKPERWWPGTSATPGSMTHRILKVSEKKVRQIFREQIQWAKSGGADFIIAETFTHFGEALLSLEEIKAADLPAVVTFSPVAPATCDGFSLAEACKRLEDNGCDVVGLNCGRGPKTMLPVLKGHPPGGDRPRGRPAGALPHP
jgi:methionine synthase I (cobalamin-dependent)